MCSTKNLIIVLFVTSFFSCNQAADERIEYYKHEAEVQRLKAEQMTSLAAEERTKAERSAALAIRAEMQAKEKAEQAMEMAKIAEMKALEATKALAKCKSGN